jgi:hypothetical protein
MDDSCLQFAIVYLSTTYVDMWSLTRFFFLSFVFSRIRKRHFSVLGVRCHFTCRTTADRPGRSQSRTTSSYVTRACDTYRRGNQVNRKPDIRCMSERSLQFDSVGGSALPKSRLPTAGFLPE